MKIEIGESLIYSYLRHSKQCKITQTNWKTSGTWQIKKEVFDECKKIFDEINEGKAFNNLFPSGFEQTLKQTEIDVVGISENTIYAVEVAYHENGLQYGNKKETRLRVTKKLIRILLVLKCYFPEYKYSISFVSPKVNNATDILLRENLKIIQNEIRDDNLISFEYIANDDFIHIILNDVLEKTTTEADTSELFSRSIKILKIMGVLNPNDDKQKTLIPVKEKVDIDSIFKSEITKVHKRIPKWLSQKDQINSRILNNFMKLYYENDGCVTYDELRSISSDIDNFGSNFNGMKNISDRNHGKVFEQIENAITLWDEVEEFILNEYEKHRITSN